MGVEANCIGVVESAIRGLGGLDVVISNAVSAVLLSFVCWGLYEYILYCYSAYIWETWTRVLIECFKMFRIVLR